MKKIFIFCATLGALTLGGCKKLLDKTPEDSVSTTNFFTKETDAILALNGVFDMYVDRGTGSNSQNAADNFYGGAFQSSHQYGDDIYVTLTGASNFPGNQRHDATGAQILTLWKILWF